MTKTAWKKSFGTYFNSGVPCDWQEKGGSQDKQNYCMVTGGGVELEKAASGHEMSNQESEKRESGRYLELQQ